MLVHINVQGQVQSDFAKRMYIYKHRLFDRYNKEVISLAVLGDDQANWQPTEYGYARWGFQSRLQFPIAKLLDYQAQWTALEQNTNPFAVIIMAHLRTQATPLDIRQLHKILLVIRLFAFKKVKLVSWFHHHSQSGTMLKVPIEEIQRDFTSYLHQIEAGETIIIVQAGKPVAEIKPIAPSVKQLRHDSSLCWRIYPPR